LRGKNEALAISKINDFQVKDQRLAATFENMHATSADRILNGTGRETFDAIKIMQSIQKASYAGPNSKYPRGRLEHSLEQTARIIKANVWLEVAFTDVGGWDTHVK
jgi:hypothetical protein